MKRIDFCTIAFFSILNSMLAKVLKLHKTDATCYVLITKLILMTKNLDYELNYELEVI